MDRRYAAALIAIALILIITTAVVERRRPSSPTEAGLEVAAPIANVIRKAQPARPSSGPTEPARIQAPVDHHKDALSEEVAKLRAAARSTLSLSYAAQKSFFEEYHRYTTDLKAGGILPESQILPYKFGFLIPFNPSEPADTEILREKSTRMTTDDLIGEEDPASGTQYRYAPSAQKINLSAFAKYCEMGCTASETGFEILVAVPLPNTDRVDVWRINDRKELELVQDGMAKEGSPG